MPRACSVTTTSYFFAEHLEGHNEADTDLIWWLLELEMNNSVALLRVYLPSVVVEGDGDLAIDQHRLDQLTSRSYSTRIYLRGGVPRRASYSVASSPIPNSGTGCRWPASPPWPVTAGTGRP
jgi:hypothetical protein